MAQTTNVTAILTTALAGGSLTRLKLTPARILWVIIIATALVDVVLAAIAGMTLIMSWIAAGILALLCSIAAIYRSRGPALSRTATVAAQIIAFSIVAPFLTYVAMAMSPFPLADDLLSRADQFLGLNWVGWFTWVNAHQILHVLLIIAYSSVPIQILPLVLYFSVDDYRRIDEFLLGASFAVLINVPVMVLFPAIGAWSYYHVGIEPWRADILDLRSHNLSSVSSMQGIVTFPSFHAALAVLLSNMVRGRKWFLPVLVLNLLMIVSALTEGAHYLVDLAAGIAMAFVAIGVSRSILRWCDCAPATVLVPGPLQPRPAGRKAGKSLT
jgi:membrane-associated phospholipid phosphatase